MKPCIVWHIITVRPHNTFMKISRLSKVILVAVAMTLFDTHPANTQGYISFDAANSDVGAGLYYFNLTDVTILVKPGMDTGIELSAGRPLTFSGFASIGNTQDIGYISSPAGWPALFPRSDMDSALYEIDPLKWVYNGTFIISATPNLSGTINWSFGELNGMPLSGSATINSVPEPTSLAFLSIAVALFFSRRILSTTV